MTRLRNILALVRGQLWIVPALITAAAAALAYFLLRYGAELLAASGDTWWLYSGDASTARDLLSSLLSCGVPHVAVTVASALTIACLFALLFYIHKIARSIIADNVVEAVAGNLRHNIRDILKDGVPARGLNSIETLYGRPGLTR